MDLLSIQLSTKTEPLSSTFNKDVVFAEVIAQNQKAVFSDECKLFSNDIMAKLPQQKMYVFTNRIAKAFIDHHLINLQINLKTLNKIFKRFKNKFKYYNKRYETESII